MWSNQHPAPSKWRPLRAPAPSVITRASARNRFELTQSVTAAREAIEPAAQAAVQLLPFARILTAAVPGHAGKLLLPVRWQRVWQGKLLEEDGGGSKAAQEPVDAQSESDIDEIEDC